MAAPTTVNPSAGLSWDKADKTMLKPPHKKQNPLMLMAVVAALVLGISGLWRATHQNKPSEWIRVVGAGKDIPAGTRLSFTSLRYVEFPKQFLQKDMAHSLSDVEGNVARTFIPQGEPIRAAMVFKGRNNLAGVLETHERAITLQLADDDLVDHAIEPDDHVDVLVVSTKNSQKFTKTIYQQARVLICASKEQLTARHMGGSSTNKITIAVTPDAAESMAEAAEVGKIRLVLRNKLGRTEPKLAGVSEDDLLPASAFAPPRALLAAQPKIDLGAASALPPPPFPPPPIAEMADVEVKDVAGAPGPAQWMVDMFAGTKKESIPVSAM